MIAHADGLAVRRSSWPPALARRLAVRPRPTGRSRPPQVRRRAPLPGAEEHLVVGKFDNRSSYLRGLFSDGVDRLGGQAKGILVTHLQQTGRFNVVERDNLEEITREAEIKGAQQLLRRGLRRHRRRGRVRAQGSRRRAALRHPRRGKKQIAYSKVNLNVVNVLTSEVIYSVQGAGEYELSSREVLGFGGTSGLRLHPERQGAGPRHPRGGQPPGRGRRRGKWTPARN